MSIISNSVLLLSYQSVVLGTVLWTSDVIRQGPHPKKLSFHLKYQKNDVTGIWREVSNRKRGIKAPKTTKSSLHKSKATEYTCYFMSKQMYFHSIDIEKRTAPQCSSSKNFSSCLALAQYYQHQHKPLQFVINLDFPSMCTPTESEQTKKNQQMKHQV